MRTAYFVLLAHLVAATAAAEPIRERSALERDLASSPAAREQRAGVELLEQRRRRQETEGGWEAFGNLETGTVNEVITDDQRRRYDQARAQIGLRYPLLGSQAEQRRAMERIERERIRAEGVRQARLRTLRARLRAAYADYWTAHQRERLARSWRDRLADGLVPEDLRPGGAVRGSGAAEVELALQEAEDDLYIAQANKRAALRAMESHLGDDIPEFLPVWPGATPICTRRQELMATANRQNPRLDAMEKEVALLLDRPETGLIDEVDSNLFIAHGQTLDEWRDRGDRTRIGLTFTMPLALDRAHNRRQQLRTAQLHQAQHELTATRQSMMRTLDDDLARFQRTDRLRQTAQRRLRHARTTWREAMQRQAAGMDDGVLAPLRQGVSWYARAKDRLAREGAWLRARIPLEALTSADCASTRAAPPNRASLHAKAAPGSGFYVWDSAALARRAQTTPDYLDRLREQGFTRLHLSFTAEQVRRLESGADGWLRELLQRIAVAGIDADLLLGDPHWTLAAHRDELLALISTFSGYPFAGVHLDIEIDQLPGADDRRAELFRERLHTFEAVARTSSLPLAASVHPRYLQAGPWGECPVCRLRDAGVDELVAMIYTTRPERVIDRLRPHVREHGDIRFSVAQSVEADLPEANSYHASGRDAAAEVFARLSTALARPNFDGVVVQSWTQWEAMAP